jgi:hypothetical protein
MKIKKLITLLTFSLIINNTFAVHNIFSISTKYYGGEGGQDGTLENRFIKGKNMYDMYVGFPNSFKNQWKQFENFGSFKNSSVVPFGIKFEHALTNEFGIIAGITYVSGKSSWKVAYLDSTTSVKNLYEKGFTYSATSFFVGVSNHPFTNDFLDIYINGGLGYTLASFAPYSKELINYYLEKPTNIKPMYYAANFGIRYFVSNQVALFANVGVGSVSNVNAGFTYRGAN